jgi:hypothetical protein
MADCVVGGNRLDGLGTAARAGLRRLPGCSDQLSDKFGVRTAPRMGGHMGGGILLNGRHDGDEGSGHVRFLSHNGTLLAFGQNLASGMPWCGMIQFRLNTFRII